MVNPYTIKSLKKTAVWLVVFILIDKSYTYFTSWMVDLFIGDSEKIFKGNDDVVKSNFEIVVFYGPFIETLFFQFMLIWIFYNILESYKISIIISAVTFSIFHFFNIYYVIAAFGGGLIYATFFSLIHNEYKNWFIALIFTFLLHLEHNLYSFYVNH